MGPKKLDPETYEVEQANQEPSKESKRVKKQQDKLKVKQEFFLDSQQEKFVDFEAQSNVSCSPFISQATLLKAMIGDEVLEDSSEYDKKVNTDKSNKPTK